MFRDQNGRELAIGAAVATLFSFNPGVASCIIRKSDLASGYPSSAEEGRACRDHQGAGTRISQFLEGDRAMDHDQPSWPRRALRRRLLRDEPRD